MAELPLQGRPVRAGGRRRQSLARRTGTRFVARFLLAWALLRLGHLGAAGVSQAANRGVAVTVGGWFLAHRHGRLQGFADANKNGVDDRLESAEPATSSEMSS